MRRLNSLGLILTLCFCAGCFPFHYTMRPGVKGVVVDGRSGWPLPEATIQLTLIEGYWGTNEASTWHPKLIASTNCDLTGGFSLRPQKKWGIYIVPMDVFQERYQVMIQCTNHLFEQTNFYSDSRETGKYGILNLGRVTLTPE